MAENETLADPELQRKKRARRRLVGAAALALLAIIVLPMVMDHEPRPAVQDIEVQIPSKETGGVVAKILSDEPAVLPLPETVTRHDNAKAEENTSTDKSSDTVIATVPVAGDVSPVESSAEPAVKPQASEDPAKQSVENQKWVVQRGAYKEAGNVKQLLSKLKELGLPAYTEKMTSDQGQRTRVRAGPFASRELAEKADAKIKKIGVVGKVTAK